MSLFSIVSATQALSLQGSYRGIGFAYAEGEDEPGRRIEGFMFPGRNITAWQDLGQWDGDIPVHGILSGDDYAHQWDRFRTAFQTPGPGTLVSPWWGTIQVVQSPGKPPKATFKSDELRIVRFIATFRRYVPRVPPSPNTLQGLLDSLADMKTAAMGMLGSILAPAALVLSAVSQVEALAGEVATTLGGLILSCSNPLVGAAGALPIGLLSSIDAAPMDATYPAAAGAILQAPSAAIAATSTPAIPSAVASGSSTATPVPVDGRVTAALLLSANTAIGSVSLTAAPIVIPPGAALIAVQQTFFLADAASAASAIAFDSQMEATTWRNQVAAALDAAALAAAALVPSYPAPGAALWRSLIAAKAAWMAMLNGLIGTLPAVTIFSPPGQSPVWVLAQYLAGDNPSLVVPMYRDLVSRNGISHPALPAPGPLEVLGDGAGAYLSAPRPASGLLTTDLAAPVTTDLGLAMEVT